MKLFTEAFLKTWLGQKLFNIYDWLGFKLGWHKGWLAGKYMCLECYKDHVTVHPYECDDEALECPHCGAMNGTMVDYYSKQKEKS